MGTHRLAAANDRCTGVLLAITPPRSTSWHFRCPPDSRHGSTAHFMLSRTQSFELGAEFGNGRLELHQALALLLDHRSGRALDEIAVCEFGFGFGDFRGNALDLLAEPRTLGRRVDFDL